MQAVMFMLVIIILPIYMLFYQQEKVVSIYPLNKLPIYVVNTSDKSLMLYSAKQPEGKPIDRLRSRATFLYQYSGSSGSWWYGIKGGRSVVLKRSQKELAFKVAGIVIPFSYIAWGLSLLVGLYFISNTLKKLMGKVRNKRDLSDRLSMENTRLRTELAKVSNVNLYERQALEQKAAKANANYMSLYNRQIDEKNKSKQAMNTEKKSLEAAFKRKEKEWLDKVNEESETRTNVRVEHMQASYNRLHNAYKELKSDHDRIKSEGLVFDINFDGERYESILKGRQFEIFFANQLMQDSDFEILEWTSDKGTENEIYVSSNGNPDFLFQYDKRFKFAVECKYRGKHFEDYRKKQNTIQWANVTQADRYKVFGTQRQVPVFIALGFLGEATRPLHTYLPTLNTLLGKSYEYDISTSKSPLLLVQPESLSSNLTQCDALAERLIRDLIHTSRLP
jgi:hypothetical protein